MRDLPPRLELDRLHDEAHRVHVLDLAARPELGRPLRPHADVDVGPQRALLHVAVAGAEIAQDLPELPQVLGRLLGAADVGPRDDLHQRDAGAVQVDEGQLGVDVVHRLAGVLLEVDALDPHLARDPRPEVDDHLALADDRVVELADLVALRQVGVEVVLAVEAREAVDRRLQPEPGPHRLLDAEAVDHRQHPRHRRVDQADVGVRRAPKAVEAPENSLAFEATWACTSMPTTTSQSPVAPAMVFGSGSR